MQKKQIPRKHVGKKCTEQQEKEIKEVQDNMQKNRGNKPVAWLEAKHKFFEREERLKEYGVIDKKTIPKDLKQASDVIKENQPKSFTEGKGTPAQQIADTTPEPKKPRIPMTIEQTKLGVTMVLSKEDCKVLGFLPEAHTKKVIEVVRKQLKLPSREELRAKKKVD